MLRDYQSKWVSEIISLLTAGKRVLGQMPTGAGKTVCLVEISKHFRRVMIVAHRKELVYQAAKHFRRQGIEPGIVMSRAMPGYDRAVQIASIQSLFLRKGDIGLSPDLIIFDEAHRALSQSYLTIVDMFPNASVLGVTATPIRLDGYGLGRLFDELVLGKPVSALIREGYLSDIDYYVLEDFIPDREKLPIRRGDYQTNALDAWIKTLGNTRVLAEEWLKKTPQSKGITFATSIRHSLEICETFNLMGIKAFHLDGKTPTLERRRTLDLFNEGKIQVISNVGLFDEGFDAPDLKVVQIARPTLSLGKYLQMCGRAMRPNAGGENSIILDHTSNWLMHGLPTQDRKWILTEGCRLNLEVHEMTVSAESGLVSDFTDHNYLSGESSAPLVKLDKEREQVSINEKIRDLVKDGLGCREIAKRVGFGRSAVLRRMTQMGISDTNKAKGLSEAQRRQILALRKKGKSTRYIANYIGTSQTTVMKVVRSARV